MNAVGYIRVSTPGQSRDGVSLAAQKAKIRAWATLTGATVIEVYADAGISGATLGKRQGLQRAIEHACREHCPLVVYSLSRFARSTRDTIELSTRLSKAGADLVSLSEDINTTSASGKMIFRMLAVLAEFESDQVAERTRTAMAHLKSQGRRISRYAPYGWDFSRDGKRLLPVKREQSVAVWLRKRKRAGATFSGLARQLNRQGVTAKRGGSWSAKTVRDVVRRDALT